MFELRRDRAKRVFRLAEADTPRQFGLIKTSNPITFLRVYARIRDLDENYRRAPRIAIEPDMLGPFAQFFRNPRPDID